MMDEKNMTILEMMKDEVRILYEASKDCGISNELASIALAMCEVVKTINRNWAL